MLMLLVLMLMLTVMLMAESDSRLSSLMRLPMGLLCMNSAQSMQLSMEGERRV